MQLKTFTASSMSAVLLQIKEEMGADAIILDTSEDNGMVSITAALERKSEYSVSSYNETEAPLQPASWQQWHREWDSIKGYLLTLMKPQLQLDKLPPTQRVALEFLQRDGMGDEATLELVRMLQDDSQCSILKPLSKVVKIHPWSENNWPQRCHVVAGPFGAGKTSVVIRLALALRKENPSSSICVINADATRGNGRLLLRHYSELSDLQYKEASSTFELVDAINQAEKEGFEKILIDLPGLSRGKYLQSLLEDAGLTHAEVAVHLAFSPHYGQEHIKNLLERYKVAQKSSIIWTKLDEANQFGSIINVAYSSKLPIAALSFGPGLGNSLTAAKDVMVWRLLFKSELPSS